MALKAFRKIERTARRTGRAVDQTVRRTTKDVEDATVRAFKNLSNEVKRWPAYQWLIDNAARFFMDAPQFVKCSNRSTSSVYTDPRTPPVYYVNGLLTDLNLATQEAQALCQELDWPVWLIHNQTQRSGISALGETEDSLEAIYDRTWPAIFPSMLAQIASNPRPQTTPSTRQLTHLLYHGAGPFPLVSHSQGCLQARNAILTAAFFRGASRIGSKVRWVATGMPLSEHEILIKPKRFKSLRNNGDFVAQLIGLNGGPGTFDAMSGASHSFIKQYVDKIQAAWLLK